MFCSCQVADCRCFAQITTSSSLPCCTERVGGGCKQQSEFLVSISASSKPHEANSIMLLYICVCVCVSTASPRERSCRLALPPGIRPDRLSEPSRPSVRACVRPCGSGLTGKQMRQNKGVFLEAVGSLWKHCEELPRAQRGSFRPSAPQPPGFSVGAHP